MDNLYKGTLTERKQLSADTSLFVIQLDRPITFIPGQFGMLSILNDQKEMKPFSFCSLPNSSIVEFCVKIYPDGRFSPKLFEKEIGSTVEVKGPFGLFALKESTSDLIFIAAGTGIAPLRSIINFLLQNKYLVNV